jgi:hypothetical protein
LIAYSWLREYFLQGAFDTSLKIGIRVGGVVVIDAVRELRGYTGATIALIQITGARYILPVLLKRAKWDAIGRRTVSTYSADQLIAAGRA